MLPHAKLPLLPYTTPFRSKLSVTSLDGTASQDILVTIAGTNDKAVIDAASVVAGHVTEDDAAHHTASGQERKSTRLNSRHRFSSYAVLGWKYVTFSYAAAPG